MSRIRIVAMVLGLSAPLKVEASVAVFFQGCMELFIMTKPGGEHRVEEHFSNILLVEDREEDVLFFRRAFKTAGLHHSITHVPDGDEAIKYLSRQAPYND